MTNLLSRLGHLDVVLDLASGTGRLTPVFSAHARTVLQVDSALPMLHVSRESAVTPPSLGYVQADARRLPLADASFDLVFCHRLLNHLPKDRDRVQVITQMARVSRRFVTISCLTPPAIIRLIRRAYLRRRRPLAADGFVETADLLRQAEQAGLRLRERTSIRSGIRSAAFFTFEKA